MLEKSKTLTGYPGRAAMDVSFEHGTATEDNRVNQKVAQRMLHKLGVSVDTADNGLKVIQIAQRISFDVIFMDCQMPEMDGFTATAELRKTEHDCEPRTIIAMTANAMQGDRERCISAGMNDFIAKPVRIAELERVLRTWTSTHRLAVELDSILVAAS